MTNSTISARGLLGALRSARVRAALSLGVVLTVGVTGTFAFFTDSVDVTGTTFSAANLDLQVDNGDTVATTTLGMSLMLPGYSSAQVLTVKNNGNVPLKYTMTGGLTGTDAAAYNTAAELRLTVRLGGTRGGSANAFTCTGGTVLYGPTALTNVTSTALIGTRRPAAGLAASATESLCFQVDFISTAGNSLINKTATATFSLLGTSDVS
ncbi:hypothetical protein H5V45_19530 [Nocardioides sp. KIGAM211]|uniref:SipW-cognate class signal peptide n=1 Tax=Nocardioides luti TaxID=2761101 RepID=A0A7X0RJM0_9ACTN|nr:TasA family protein [Nocardioides luti]MBB6629526.1 hypothetical protein [Nocardioides luti]